MRDIGWTLFLRLLFGLFISTLFSFSQQNKRDINEKVRKDLSLWSAQFLTVAMARTEELPEEIMLNIFSRLPVKSLIRFTSVSKRLRFIILSDPKFAQSQLKAARLSRRLLVSTDAPQLQSLPLADTPSFGASVRNLTLPSVHHRVRFLGSCSGLVFLTCHQRLLYVWNPSLGFLKQLPDPGFSSDRYILCFHGAAYFSDDYRLFACHYSDDVGVWEYEVEMFSLRTHIWKRIESPGSNFELDGLGILSNEAFHWLSSDENELVCFRLAEEEFRRMQLPNDDGNSFSHIGVCGGCLCVSRFPKGAWDYMELWVMKEYEVSDSWTMLFRLELSDPFNWLKAFIPTEVLVLESSIVSKNWTAGGYELLRIDHKEDNKRWRYMLERRQCSLIEYEESLLWISGYQSVKETQQVPILETDHKA